MSLAAIKLLEARLRRPAGLQLGPLVMGRGRLWLWLLRWLPRDAWRLPPLLLNRLLRRMPAWVGLHRWRRWPARGAATATSVLTRNQLERLLHTPLRSKRVDSEGQPADRVEGRQDQEAYEHASKGPGSRIGSGRRGGVRESPEDQKRPKNIEGDEGCERGCRVRSHPFAQVDNHRQKREHNGDGQSDNIHVFEPRYFSRKILALKSSTARVAQTRATRTGKLSPWAEPDTSSAPRSHSNGADDDDLP